MDALSKYEQDFLENAFDEDEICISYATILAKLFLLNCS